MKCFIYYGQITSGLGGWIFSLATNSPDMVNKYKYKKKVRAKQQLHRQVTWWEAENKKNKEIVVDKAPKLLLFCDKKEAE